MTAMSFAPRPSVEWSDAFEAIIDRAMQAENAAQPPRSYLGASRLGEECLRKLSYEFTKQPKDEGREFKGATLRIFERGHTGEELMADRLRRAGFGLVTHKADGGQIGFATGWSEELQQHLISGHIDGVVTSVPKGCDLAVPALWENKILGEKSWTDTVKKGVRASKPVYFVQMQLYMAHLDLADNPGLFTAENANTGAIYAERIGFDLASAQAAIDKGVKVVTTRDPRELPRVTNTASDFRCKFCDYAATCWADPNAAAAAPAPTAWTWGAKADVA